MAWLFHLDVLKWLAALVAIAIGFVVKQWLSAVLSPLNKVRGSVCMQRDDTVCLRSTVGTPGCLINDD